MDANAGKVSKSNNFMLRLFSRKITEIVDFLRKLSYIEMKYEKGVLMTKRFHGLLSSILLDVPIVLAIVYLWLQSFIAGLIYAVGCFIAMLVMIYSYCAKCVCSTASCGHIFPKYVTKFLPKRKAGKYLFRDYLGLFVSFGFIVIYPQFWIYSDILLLIAFWMPILLSALEIYFFLCKNCENINCKMSRR